MIFISLASYRDPELLQTITSACEMADDPSSLVFGVYSQVAEGEHPDLSGFNVREVVVPYTDAQGAGYARSEVQKLYRDEEYFLQIDAHTLFEPHWDTRLVTWHKNLSRYCEQTIISGWCAPYTYEEGLIVNGHETESWQWEPHTTKCRSFRQTWIGSREPMNMPFGFMEVLLGGFIFASGEFVKDVPYDPRMAWWGEEFNLTVRARCAGYNIYAINESLLRHNYVRHGNKRVWDDNPRWDQLTLASIKAQRDLLTLKDESPYRIDESNYVFYFEYLHEIDKRYIPGKAERLYRNALKVAR